MLCEPGREGREEGASDEGRREVGEGLMEDRAPMGILLEGGSRPEGSRPPALAPCPSDWAVSCLLRYDITAGEII